MDGRGSRITQTLKSQRQLIIRMWLAGSSARVISHATGISISTVHRWVRRWREEGTIEMRPYSYYKKCTTAVPFSYTRWIPSAYMIHTYADNYVAYLPVHSVHD
ncbi:hypothetical protein Pmani_006038 [Petrolisthes manimaculis]|uniref:Uncharacterized protein n=1 Tax=Petrolisthes manimaculis TaxID=1843537 RepID=A0AAE1UJZ6_9EUCA|nr:hypothetical protein Pmani_006038 [Petrolisthes manimaculis]